MSIRPLSEYEIDISQYKRGKKIGIGGYGTVFLVVKKSTNKNYAAKVINCETEEESQKYIDNEIRHMSFLNHQAIIKFKGYSKVDFLGDPNIIVVMKYAENDSLSKILKDARNSTAPPEYSETSRQIILIGTTCGMKYMHEHNIIHGDLAPKNILLDRNLHPKITDFGLSRMFDFNKSMEKSNAAFGTLPYMAPEVINQDNYDRKADVYSFGIIMFEVVTGDVPYPDLLKNKIANYAFQEAVCSKNYRPKFEKPELIKDPIKKLIEQCWSANIEERPTFNDIFNKLSNTKNDEYLLDGVDTTEINDYVDDITEVELTERIKNELEAKNMLLLKENETLKGKIKANEAIIKNFRNENDMIKKQITFSTFNNLSISLQQSLISNIISISPRAKNIQFFNNLNNLLNYLLKNKCATEVKSNCISITSSYNDQLLSETDDEVQLQILSDTTFNLFRLKLLNSTEFINILRQFNHFSIELNNKSEKFTEIYTSLIDLRQTQFNDDDQFKISILITEINKGDLQFYNDTNINIVKISRSVSSIQGQEDKGYFEGCSSLINVEIPSSVTKIGERSFRSCINLNEIKIPLSVKEIGSLAFNDCPMLTQISIPSKVETIGNETFQGCTSLSLSKEMTAIPDHCFSQCSSLRQIFIPSSIKSIGPYSFENCTSLVNILIPSSVTMIYNFAFVGCTSLKKISLPPKLREIGNFLFSGCSSLEQISIPDHVTSIGNLAFSGCSSLKEVKFPSSLKTIGNLAFNECSSLTNIEFLLLLNKLMILLSINVFLYLPK